MGWLSRHRRARAALLVATGATVGLVLLAFVLVGIDRLGGETGAGPDVSGLRPSPTDRSSPAASPVRPSPDVEPDEPVSADPPSAPLPEPPETNDPDTYAAAIAEVLLGMDYANHEPRDYEWFFEDAVWDEIGPGDIARILTTISRRIPTMDMWEQMRSIEQTSEFEVELVWEPRLARTHRSQGDWPDGWSMRTVSGTQTESWDAPDEDQATSTRPAAVTVAMACPPAASPCRLIGIGPHVES
jgi:hypothetical protein